VIVKGIVHCHSSASHDATVDLATLATAISRAGFQFVAMTEHSADISPDRYLAYVHECARLTNASFLVIPGLEVECENEIEVAGLGLTRPVAEGSVEEVVARVREQGGCTVWVHPFKRNLPEQVPPEYDTVEVLNGKVDGTVAPSFSALRLARRQRRDDGRPHAIFGLDLHNLDESPCVWVECSVPTLTGEAVVAALRHGHFVNRAGRLSLPSSGRLSPAGLAACASLRAASLTWDWLLRVSHPRVRTALLSLTRRCVARIKAESTKPLHR